MEPLLTNAVLVIRKKVRDNSASDRVVFGDPCQQKLRDLHLPILPRQAQEAALYVEEDYNPDGSLRETRTWNDDGSFTRRNGAGAITEQAAMPPGIVKAIGEYNDTTVAATAESKVPAARAAVAADRAAAGTILGGLTTALLGGYVQHIQDLLLALTDSDH